MTGSVVLIMDPSYQQPYIYLTLAAFLLAAGIYGLVRRRTLIGMLIAGELIFSAASLNFVTMNHFFVTDPAVGQIFVLFIMALAAAEDDATPEQMAALARHYMELGASIVGACCGSSPAHIAAIAAAIHPSG